ncbi:MAG: hypothetical protein IPG96_07045 [Proteobacteria bacterium]|nr:hypothetical protein [Pseudomonadota bacterium]
MKGQLRRAQVALLSFACGALALPLTAARADTPRRSYASPQSFALELKLGPYSPDLDSEFASKGTTATPFADLFGGGSAVLWQTEFDVQLWRGFGSIAIGGSAGYYSKAAAACRQGDATDPAQVSCAGSANRVSGDSTRLTLVPLAALLIYRFDVLADRLNVPLVPYFKGGLNYTLWWMRNGSGSVSTATPPGGTTALRGQGGNLGWQLAGGLALRLDALEPSAARRLDADYGVNHSYLFGELVHVESKRLPDVGDTTFSAGIAFEF